MLDIHFLMIDKGMITFDNISGIYEGLLILSVLSEVFNLIFTLNDIVINTVI